MKLEVITQKPNIYKNKTPILFVHGMWHSAWCWAEKFMPYFAEMGYETHALSLRGHGKSEGRNKLRWASLNDYVDDVAQVVNTFEEPPILVGHSMGGLVVQKFLEKHDAAGAVLLASTSPKGSVGIVLRVARRYPIPFMKANMTLSLYPVVGSLKRCNEFFYSGNISDDDLARYFSRLQDESFRALIDMMFLSLPKPERVKTQMLVLGGDKDSVLKQDEVEETATAYNSQTTIFPGMSHNMMLDPNWQAVADYIIDWLAVDKSKLGSE